jgi:hypothetical protein
MLLEIEHHQINMSTFFAILLVTHVILGLVGLMASFRVTYLLLRPEVQIRSLKISSALAFISFIISWLSGGWYYWKHYGAVVKPKIMNGDFTWAHLVFMEAKEHVFLFLPFVTFCIALIIWKNAEIFPTDALLKKRVMILSVCITIVATIITLSGILITGGAR